MPVYEQETSTREREARHQRRQRRRRRQRRNRIILTVLLAAALVGVTAFGVSRIFRDEPADAQAELPVEPQEPMLPEPQEPQEPTDAEKLEIIHTSPEYTEDLVTFADKYGQVLDFVYRYPEMKGQQHEIDLTAEAAAQEPPLLIQWDDRWGYQPYGKGLIGYSGCGPVTLTMAALYLTGDAQYTPISVAKMAEDKGYCVPGNGSSWTLISEGCQNVGLKAKELPLSESAMKQELDQDHPIIVVVGPGDFTFGGHFMLLTGYDEEGFLINDPNSRENSAKHWTYERISPQIRNLWAMSAA